MSHTVVGLFPTVDAAKDVKKAMEDNGFDSDDVSVIANDGSSNEGIGEKISSFFHSLTGGDDQTHDHYATGVNKGGALVAVHCDASQADDVAATLRSSGATGIDSDDDSGKGKSGSGYAGSGATNGATSGTGETAIPVVAEELLVGKREVERGGVRVYSRTIETPVDTDVTLRDESVSINRRMVDRVATADDFRSGVIEMQATGEEAVVAKAARVVEEVVVGKQTSQHTEAIHDTVRSTEVEVEPMEADTVGATNGR